MREHTDGEFPFANDFNAVAIDALQGTAITQGCSVSDGGTNDMTVTIASGEARIAGERFTVEPQQVTLAGADADDDRYDIVVVDETGAANDVTGTASSTPVAPSIPGASVLLAIVHVPAGTSGITDGEIKDARVVFPREHLVSKQEQSIQRRLARR